MKFGPDRTNDWQKPIIWSTDGQRGGDIDEYEVMTIEGFHCLSNWNQWLTLWISSKIFALTFCALKIQLCNSSKNNLLSSFYMRIVQESL